MKPNIPKHPCANKCTEFKGEQCKTCLVQQIEKREFDLGLAPDDDYVKTLVHGYLPGDVVVYTGPQMTPELRTVVGVFFNRIIISDSRQRFAEGVGIRHATVTELQANRRLTEAEQALAEVS